jgi:23S rRNA (uracil1939-C5)-methyltransferase
VLDLGVGGFTLVVKNGGFTQVNPAANRVLIKTLLQLGEFDRSQKVIECYCGGGNLSLPIAAHSRKLFGIEQDAFAIADARDNSARVGLQDVEFIHASAQAGLQTLLRRNVQADVVVLNPPRAGAAEILEVIPQLGATKIVYASCDPTTLARDLRRLGQSGYRVDSLQPIDLFPQTYHVETIAVAVLT